MSSTSRSRQRVTMIVGLPSSLAQLKGVFESHKGAKFVCGDDMSSDGTKCTHVVLDLEKSENARDALTSVEKVKLGRTILLAIADGANVLYRSWLYSSLEQNALANESDHFVEDSLVADMGSKRDFAHGRHFLIAEGTIIGKKALGELIRACGGGLVSKKKSDSRDAISISSKEEQWFVESIFQNKWLDRKSNATNEKRMKTNNASVTNSTSSLKKSVAVKSKDTTSRSQTPKVLKITFSSLDPGSQDVVESTINALKGAKLVRADIGARMGDVTHIVIPNGDIQSKRTLKIMHGICLGKWIVHESWVYRALEERRWGNETEHEASDRFPGCKLTRLGKSRLFENKTVSILGTTSPKPNTLRILIEAAGGKFLKTPTSEYPVDVAICSSAIIKSVLGKGKPDHVGVVKPEKWLFDGIERGNLDWSDDIPSPSSKPGNHDDPVPNEKELPASVSTPNPNRKRKRRSKSTRPRNKTPGLPPPSSTKSASTTQPVKQRRSSTVAIKTNSANERASRTNSKKTSSSTSSSQDTTASRQTARTTTHKGLRRSRSKTRETPRCSKNRSKTRKSQSATKGDDNISMALTDDDEEEDVDSGSDGAYSPVF